MVFLLILLSLAVPTCELAIFKSFATSRIKKKSTFRLKPTRKAYPKANRPIITVEKNTYMRRTITEVSIIKKSIETAKMYLKMAANSFKVIPGWLGNNHLAIILTLIVIIFSLLLPNISQKLHKNSELKAIKSVLHQMQDEVKRAEVECLAANEKIYTLQYTLCDAGTETTPEPQSHSSNTSRGLHTTQSDPGPTQNRVGFFSRFFSVSRNSSKKEVTIMSVLYTDSFDSQEKLEEVVA